MSCMLYARLVQRAEMNPPLRKGANRTAWWMRREQNPNLAESFQSDQNIFSGSDTAGSELLWRWPNFNLSELLYDLEQSRAEAGYR